MREDEALLTGGGEGVSLRPISQIQRKPVGADRSPSSASDSPFQHQGFKTPRQETVNVHETPSPPSRPASESSTPRPPRSIIKSPFRWWYLEILSVLTAAICLAGIVVVLVLYDGKPQNSWPSETLTLNGLIALLATTCRTLFMVAVAAGLAQGKWHQLSSRATSKMGSYRLGFFALFEEAARGPWGSTRLIWKFKGLHITCLGAAISVLSLAFSVFSQQLISVRTDSVTTTSFGAAGQVPRGSRQGAIWDGEEEDIPFDTQNMVISPDLKMAIYSGFMASSIDWPQVACSTGNCTWPVIPTLGVCGACVNTTNTIEVERTSGSKCAAVAPKNLSIEAECDTYDDLGGSGVWMASGPGSGDMFSSDDVPINGTSPNLIASFAGLRVGVNGTSRSVSDSVATECALWYCIQAHNISVQAGELRDEVMDTWHEAVAVDNPDESRGDKADSYADFYFTDAPETFNTDKDEVYFAVYWDHRRLRDYIGNTTDGLVRGNLNNYNGEGRSNRTGGDIVTGLFMNFGETDKFIDRLSKSMSNALRGQGWIGVRNPDEEEPWNYDGLKAQVKRKYEGTVYADQVTIVVRWGWITYLVALVALSIVFLIAQIVQTARQMDVRAWKDDPLAPMWLDLDATLKQEFRRGLENPKGAQEVVGERPVKVNRGEDGVPTGFRYKEA